MSILITGVAGFIGSRLALKLLSKGLVVIGIDNLNDYYDVKLKEYRLFQLTKYKKFKFVKIDIASKLLLEKKIRKENIKIICHLAAQAGVRYSFTNPRIYLKYNVDGFLEILEFIRKRPEIKLIYASSSSVYGKNKKIPFSPEDNVTNPVSLYAASKRANELMAESYKELFSLNLIGLRFFTVYGPWGRPDMALFKFASSILNNKPIDVFNFGEMFRDFTYIDDLVKAIRLLIDINPSKDKFSKSVSKNDSKSNVAPYRVVNIGNSDQVKLLDFIEVIEEELNIKAKKNMLPLQSGDVPATMANTKLLYELTGFSPKTNYKKGVREFIKWYRNYYDI